MKRKKRSVEKNLTVKSTVPEYDADVEGDTATENDSCDDDMWESDFSSNDDDSSDDDFCP